MPLRESEDVTISLPFRSHVWFENTCSIENEPQACKIRLGNVQARSCKPRLSTLAGGSIFHVARKRVGQERQLEALFADACIRGLRGCLLASLAELFNDPHDTEPKCHKFDLRARGPLC
jgi:hypothetical protein